MCCQDEWRFLLAGGTHKPKELPNPATGWLSERSWGDILTLAALDTFADFAVDFSNHLQKFQEIFDSIDPHRFLTLLILPAGGVQIIVINTSVCLFVYLSVCPLT